MKVELIDKYLNEELIDQEQKVFDKYLSDEPGFLKEIHLHKEIEEAVKQEDITRFRTKLDVIYGELYTKEEPKVVKLPRVKRVWYVAATIAILVTAGTFLMRSQINSGVSNEDLFNKYYQPYNATFAYRSGDEDADRLLISAMYRYEKADYMGAVQLFEKILNDGIEDEIDINLYSGISYMEIEKFAQANTSFKTIIQDNDNLFIEQAKWYLALCYIKTDSTMKAERLLLDLASEQSYYHEPASKILRKLK